MSVWCEAVVFLLLALQAGAQSQGSVLSLVEK